MKRRTFLTVTGTIVGTGCVSQGSSPGFSTDSPPTGTPSLTATSTESPSPTDTEPYAGQGDSIYKRVEIGTREDVEHPDANAPHDLSLWNKASGSRTFSVSVEVAADDESTGDEDLDTTYDVPGDQTLQMMLLEPAHYSVTIRLPTAETRIHSEIHRDEFTCNAVGYQVTASTSGTFEKTRMRNALKCPPTSPTSTPH